jgi:hypothetical protein
MPEAVAIAPSFGGGPDELNMPITENLAIEIIV